MKDRRIVWCVRRSTWLVVAAVAAVGIAAVVDALPTEQTLNEQGPEQTSALDRRPRPAGAFDARGVLYYTDDLCRLRAVALPSFTPVSALEWDECGFSLSPAGGTVMGSGVVWQSQGERRAAAISGLVYVVVDSTGLEYRLTGTAPAFRPDGTLTFVRDGAIVQASDLCASSPPYPGCERVLVTRRDLLEPLQTKEAAAEAEVKAIAWLTQTSLAAAFSFGDADDHVIAIYEGTNLVRTISGFGGRVTELLVSPGRSYAAARLERPSGFVLIDADGEPFILEEIQRDFSGRPPFTGGRALTWSPDDAWTAIARKETIVFFRMGPEHPDVVHVPLVAHDLAWVSVPFDGPAPDHVPSAG
jgi:hypothetical protein